MPARNYKSVGETVTYTTLIRRGIQSSIEKVESVLPAILPSRDRGRHESGMATNATVVPSERSVIICLITSGFRGHNRSWLSSSYMDTRGLPMVCR